MQNWVKVLVKVLFFVCFASWKRRVSIYDEFTSYFILSTTDCYSNKYLLNDFRIKWTTIKCFIPFMFMSEALFPSRNIMKLYFNSENFFPSFSSAKKQNRDLCRCLHTNMMLRKRIAMNSTDFLSVGNENHFAWLLARMFVLIIFVDEGFSSFLKRRKIRAFFLGKSAEIKAMNPAVDISRALLWMPAKCIFISKFLSTQKQILRENSQSFQKSFFLSKSSLHLTAFMIKFFIETFARSSRKFHSCGARSTVRTE